jgi:hypothetical protein
MHKQYLVERLQDLEVNAIPIRAVLHLQAGEVPVISGLEEERRKI